MATAWAPDRILDLDIEIYINQMAGNLCDCNDPVALVYPNNNSAKRDT